MRSLVLISAVSGSLLLSTPNGKLVANNASWEHVSAAMRGDESVFSGGLGSRPVFSFVHPLSPVEGIPLTTDCKDIDCLVKQIVEPQFVRTETENKRALGLSDCDFAVASEIMLFQQRKFLAQLSEDVPAISFYSPVSGVECYRQNGDEQSARHAAQEVLTMSKRFLDDNFPDSTQVIVRLDETFLQSVNGFEGFDLYVNQPVQPATEEAEFESAQVRRLQIAETPIDESNYSGSQASPAKPTPEYQVEQAPENVDVSSAVAASQVGVRPIRPVSGLYGSVVDAVASPHLVDPDSARPVINAAPISAYAALNAKPRAPATGEPTQTEIFAWNIRVMTSVALALLFYYVVSSMVGMEIPRDNLLYTKMSAA